MNSYYDQMKARDKQLVKLYQPIIDGFKKDICEKGKDIDPGEELDWNGVALGYFIAKGVIGQDEEPFDHAHSLARICRYDFQYWQ